MKLQEFLLLQKERRLLGKAGREALMENFFKENRVEMICHKTPFSKSYKYMFFVENRSNAVVSSYVMNHTEELKRSFRAMGYEFIVLTCFYKDMLYRIQPKYLSCGFIFRKALSHVSRDANTLEMLGCEDVDFEESAFMSIEKIIPHEKLIFGGMKIQGQTESEVEKNIMLFFDILRYSRENKEWLKNIRLKCNIIAEDEIVESANQRKPENIDDKKTHEVVADIQKQLDYLRAQGFTENMIKSIFMAQKKVCRLVVTKDLKILLPDYDYKEVQMAPLDKATYLLFLKHPEGINFSAIYDYREELKSMYRQIKGGVLSASQERSVELLCNPLDNSINEKRTHILKAFEKYVGTSEAQNYCLQGMKGENKRILLDRQNIEWRA